MFTDSGCWPLAFGQFSLWDLWNLNSRLTTKLDRLDRQTFGLVWVCAFVHQTTSPVANQPFACKRACNAMSKTWNYGTITTEDSVPGWLKGNTQANKKNCLSRGKTELASYDCVLGNIRNLTQVWGLASHANCTQFIAKPSLSFCCCCCSISLFLFACFHCRIGALANCPPSQKKTGWIA